MAVDIFQSCCHKAKNLRSSFEFGSLYENLRVDGSKVKAEISLASEFKFQPKWGYMRSFGNTLSVAPGYLCQLISSSLNNNSCGSDIHIALIRNADGQKLIDFQLQNLTDTETFSASLSIVVPLSNYATLNHVVILLCQQGERVALTPVKVEQIVH